MYYFTDKNSFLIQHGNEFEVLCLLIKAPKLSITKNFPMHRHIDNPS